MLRKVGVQGLHDMQVKFSHRVLVRLLESRAGG